ncbi:NAD-dependent DNA ligase LigA, partial [Buchnera aphidicola (Hormaphis cornu)]
EIRGEVFMLRSDFNKLNSTITNNCIKNFSNPRNIAAGSLRQTNFQVIVNRRLKFVCHGAGFIQGSNQFDSHYSRFKIFQKWGIPVFKNVFFVS